MQTKFVKSLVLSGTMLTMISLAAQSSTTPSGGTQQTSPQNLKPQGSPGSNQNTMPSTTPGGRTAPTGNYGGQSGTRSATGTKGMKGTSGNKMNNSKGPTGNTPNSTNPYNGNPPK